MVKEPQRTLTPEEVARRKAAAAGDDPLKRANAAVPMTTGQVSGHGPREGFARRVERAAQTISPQFIDYDRDGYPDAFVGRSGRNYTQRARAANYRGRGGAPENVIYGGMLNLGADGYRQDQVGYRDRLRGRLAALGELAEEADDKDEAAQRRLRAMAHAAVPSHAKTGVGGGMPQPLPRQDAPGHEAMRPRYTPTQQALMAPRTIPSGQPRNPARKPTPAEDVPLGGDRVLVALPLETPAPPGNEGAFGTTRRASYGSIPVQGTTQPDGSFQVGGPAAGGEEPPPDGGDGGRTVERTRTVTRTVDPARTGEHAKQGEHKPGEHKPPEHKPHEHGKPPEHKK